MINKIHIYCIDSIVFKIQASISFPFRSACEDLSRPSLPRTLQLSFVLSKGHTLLFAMPVYLVISSEPR